MHQGELIEASFLIKDDDTAADCLAAVAKIPRDGKHVVWIREAKHYRSLAQNSLYWGVWMKELSRVTGFEVQELHDRFKPFIIRIYMGDPKTITQMRWVELYEAVKKHGDREATRKAGMTVSTQWATKEQFTEYLNQIDRFSIEKGIPLPRTDDYKFAMGLG